jgi:Tfp pilus assembly protein PilW
MRFYRKNQKVRNQDGFTIVELLIYMGLLVIMIVIFTQIFVSILDNQLRSTNTSNVADDGRYIYSRFIYDVNRADSIASPSAFGSEWL